jgi:putative glycosyltransferase (TIGR04372 family)
LAAKAFGLNDIYIPKLLRDKNTGQYLKFSEILRSPVANFREATHYIKAGVDLEENSSEDINDLVQEALKRIQKKWEPSIDDEERQRKFKSLFLPEHYGYNSQSKIGSSFLEKYQHLI